MSIAAKARARAAAAFPWTRPSPPTSGANAPLVPTDTAAGALPGGRHRHPHLPRGPLRGRRRDGRRQCRPVADQRRPGGDDPGPSRPGRDVDADVAKAQRSPRTSPASPRTRIFSKAESERLLEPWLGTGLDLTDLPVPRLIALKMSGERTDLGRLRTKLTDALPASRASTTRPVVAAPLHRRERLRGAGVGLVVLVLVATGLAVTFATRGAMAGNKEVVEVLHFVGAGDDYIARAFQARFFGLGLRGGGSGRPAPSSPSSSPGSSPARPPPAGGPGDRGPVRRLPDRLARLSQHRPDRGNRLPRDRRRLAHHGAEILSLIATIAHRHSRSRTVPIP